MNKVPLSLLCGHTPVTVRFGSGIERTLVRIDVVGKMVNRFCEREALCVTDGDATLSFELGCLVEVLPAKQAPTPLTDSHIKLARQLSVDHYHEFYYVLPEFARKLEIERAALLALVERVANSNADDPWQCAGSVADARALLAQLKTP